MSTSQQILLGNAPATGGYQIERSLRFNSADSAYLNRTPASDGNRQTWTLSFWLKLGAISTNRSFFGAGSNGSNYFLFYITNGDQIRCEEAVGGVNTWLLRTTPVYRDPSSWYHIVMSFDSPQATSSNRIKMYVNGVQVTAFASSTYPSQNLNSSFWNATSSHNIGAAIAAGVAYGNGYLTEINFIDGSALDPTSFGEFNTDTGVWQPIEYTGSYGTNGFYLNFSDNASTTTLGDDLSGNGNDWTTNNFSVTAGAGNDSLVDTPTNYGTDTGVGGEVRGNYATLNPLDTNSNNTLANGNLNISRTTASWGSTRCTFGMSSGKWYFEYTCTNDTTNNAHGQQIIGIGLSNASLGTYTGSDANGWGYSAYDGKKYNNQSGGTGTGTAYGSSWTNGDVIGIAFDADSGTLTFYKNGVSQGSAYTGLGANTYFPMFGLYGNATTASAILNAGQRPFAYTAPSGFKALCTQNLPTPTILDGGDYFNTVLYTGTGSTRTVTGVGFQPDWVWIKSRSDAYNNSVWDAVRGAGQRLITNATDAEETQTGDMSAFASDGFTVGVGNITNQNTKTYVAWNWKANGAGVSNTAGTITSTVSANTDSGFSIVTYTGTGSAATIGHGLGAVPRMIIVKNRDQADAWQVYHAANTANPETDYLVLNTTAATADAADRWNDTLPTSTVFSIGNGAEVNTNTEKYVAYCFAAIPGYSAISSFTGNGSADGPFIFTNHRPAFVLIKRTDTTSNWTILDFQREGYNVDNDPLYPNLANAEGTTDLADLLSNGFKLRTTDASVNASGGTYIYMSLASNPFKYSLGR